MTTFWYFQCSHCKTWAVTTHDAGSHVRCNGCRGAKGFKYRTPGDSQEVIDYCQRYGVAHLPLPRPNQLNPCVRCDVQFRNVDLRRRPDGLVCRECYHAEDAPVPPKVEGMSEQEDMDRMEAAYAAQEKTS